MSQGIQSQQLQRQDSWRHLARASASKPLLAMLITVAVFTSSCTLYRTPPTTALALSTPKRNYSALSFKHLPAYRQVRLAVNRHDQSIEIGGGKSFVEALVLPRLPVPYRIDIHAEVLVSGDSRSSSVFMPSLTFLDSTKRLIQTVDNLHPNYQAHTIQSPAVRAAITVGNELAHARYLLVHTDPNNRGYAMSTSNSGSRLKSADFSTMVYAPVSPARYRVDFGGEGWVNLRVTAPEHKRRLIRRKPKSSNKRGGWREWVRDMLL